jgi:2,3-bisphosphoglycerate-independent phosphoglycerate mutase
MSIPSLVVLVVSGWAASPDGAHNVFARRRPPFLSEYLSSYPTLTLHAPDGEPDLAARYRLMGELSRTDERVISLSAYLSGHGVSQVRIASSDRFGLLTETMNGQTFPSDKEDWVHVSLPPGSSLVRSPQASLPLLQDAVEEALREARGKVTVVCLDAIWSVGACRDVRAVVEAVAETDRAVHAMVEAALRQKMRVLICGDMGMAEQYLSADGTQIEAKETGNPIPCVLIHPSVEGLRAFADDYAAEHVLPLKTAGSLSDIPATIAALMGLSLPMHPSGKALFGSAVAKTLL